MNTQIIPKCLNPLIFGDFLIWAYDSVKSDSDWLEISIHALSSLFVLITKNGLDYPQYYTYLYSLLLHFTWIYELKERGKFLRLLELSLKSNKISSIIVASFIKRILRICVISQLENSTLVIYCVGLVCNLLSKHTECKIMINTESSEEISLEEKRADRQKRREMKLQRKEKSFFTEEERQYRSLRT